MGNFIQIGSNNGDDEFNKVFQLIPKNKIEKIILVEPLSEFNSDLRNRYGDNVIIENSVIVGRKQSNEISFYYNKKDRKEYSNEKYEPYGFSAKYGCASINKDLLLSHSHRGFKFKEEDTVELILPCLTINELFEKYNIKSLDYLFIDAEGEDYNIINGIDFSKYYIHNIFFETLHMNIIDFLDIEQLLHQNNYMVTDKVGQFYFSCIATKKQVFD